MGRGRGALRVRYSSNRSRVPHPRPLGEVPAAESGSRPVSPAGLATPQRHEGVGRGFLLCPQHSEHCCLSFEVYFYSSETHHLVKG